MTTLNPIDLEREFVECVALIDLENIRLSWQRTYNRVFEYADLVLLCGLTERLMDATMSRIVIFATDPAHYRAQQVKITAMKQGILQGGVTRMLSDHELNALEKELTRRGILLSEDVGAGFRLIQQLEKDATISINQNKTIISSQASSVPVVVADDDDDLSEISSASSLSSSDNEDLVIREDDYKNNRKHRRVLQDDDDIEFLGEFPTRKRPRHSPNLVSRSTFRQNLSSFSLVVIFPFQSRVGGVSGSSASSSPIVIPSCTTPSVMARSSLLLSKDGAPRRIELKLYALKHMKGRLVQRGCDVALGAEITKACFHPNIDRIVVFSADSDFQELMEQNIEAEDIGGVLKFAKTSWVCGFRQAFQKGNMPNRGQSRGVYIKGNLRYIVLDEVFPQIRTKIESENSKRIRCAPH